MKLCFLADARAEHTRRWTTFFSSNGHQVDLITLNSNILSGYGSVNIHCLKKKIRIQALPFRVMNAIPIIMETKRIIRSINPDIMHAHSAGGYSWLGMMSGFHPLVITPWGTDLLSDIKSSSINRYLTLRALRYSDITTTDGYHFIKILTDLGINSDKIKLVFFGTDVNTFCPDANQKSELKKIWKISNKYVVISTRTLTPVHDVGTYLRSIPEILKKIDDVVFVVAGDGSERTNLEKLTEDLGISRSVIFTGYLTEKDLANWLKISDVYVSTSLADAGLAGSTAEAMATQLPTIVTDNADNQSWIQNNNGGFFIKERDHTKLAELTVNLLKNEELRISFGQTNRITIIQKNNYQLEMRKMESIYSDLLKGK